MKSYNFHKDLQNIIDDQPLTISFFNKIFMLVRNISKNSFDMDMQKWSEMIINKIDQPIQKINYEDFYINKSNLYIPMSKVA